MTFNPQGVAKAAERKRLTEWVMKAYDKCTCDKDKASLLDVFIRQMKELRK